MKIVAWTRQLKTINCSVSFVLSRSIHVLHCYGAQNYRRNTIHKAPLTCTAARAPNIPSPPSYSERTALTATTTTMYRHTAAITTITTITTTKTTTSTPCTRQRNQFLRFRQPSKGVRWATTATEPQRLRAERRSRHPSTQPCVVFSRQTNEMNCNSRTTHCRRSHPCRLRRRRRRRLPLPTMTETRAARARCGLRNCGLPPDLHPRPPPCSAVFTMMTGPTAPCRKRPRPAAAQVGRRHRQQALLCTRHQTQLTQHGHHRRP